MALSILQTERCCWFCGKTVGLERHHIFAGGRRKISEQNGFTVYLCHEHHTGKDGAQYNKQMDMTLKRHCQRVYERTHTRNEWMALLGKNYLED